MNYILDLQLMHNQFRGKKVSTKVRKHVHLAQPFLPLRHRQLPAASVARKRKVNFILPLYEKEEEFERFLAFFAKEFSQENVRLVVVLFDPDGRSIKKVDSGRLFFLYTQFFL